RWLYGKQICLFYVFCGMLFGICSLSILTLLSTVCCLKICFPVYACAWTCTAVFACSPLPHWGEYGAPPYGTACCIDWHSPSVNTMVISYPLVLFVFCFVLPCGVIVTSYSLVLVTVKESRKAVEQH
ncbi:OPN4 protein, partial [Amazona guildingii]|nr:OPN4 protein [Amazona guildingii]